MLFAIESGKSMLPIGHQAITWTSVNFIIKFILNSKRFILENMFEIVGWKLSAILLYLEFF